jgi:hypothetical protein
LFEFTVSRVSTCYVEIVRVKRIEEEERSGGGATVPARYSTSRVLFMRVERERERERERGPAARAMRGAGNAGHRASPTAGKREGFSF